MTIDREYIFAFRKSINKGAFKNEREFDVNNLELFKDAVYQGYLDASRTFRGIKKKDNALNNLAVNIYEYLNDENLEEDYNTLHEEWSDKLINDFASDGYKANYGQAQKIINMAFKYLLCCNDIEPLFNKFVNCHMALDQYTLNWFKREILEVKYAKRNAPHKLVEWSKLEKETYLWIQSEIREHIKDEMTVIEKEFIIWPDEMVIVSASNLCKDFPKIKDYPKHENKILLDLIKKISESTNDYLKKY